MFTETINIIPVNVIQELSIQINVQNYDELYLENVVNFTCNGNLLTYQYQTYKHMHGILKIIRI